jgi:alpha-L-fucosidase
MNKLLFNFFIFILKSEREKLIMKRFIVILLYLPILVSIGSFSFISCQKKVSLKKTATSELKDFINETKSNRDARMAWWREARFGMFIHWGLYAVPAGEYKGEQVKGIGEWIQAALNIPRNEYEKFAPQFNPVKFNADEWVRLAKDAGMKYLVITSKHHDGFCLWDSKQTDWDIVDATPYKKDILVQLKTACKKYGLKYCFYHSILDWHHPTQYVDPDASNPRAGHAKNKIFPDRKGEYVTYMKAQLKELIDNYQPEVLWFDGEWQNWWGNEDGIDLYNYVRGLKPSIIINNRVGTGRQGMSGFTRKGVFAGDFGTPEQEIPDTGLAGMDWESCMTMNDTWGYKYFDDNWKSTKTLLQNLIDITSKGGNYLLNIGPTAEGLIPDISIERLKGMGKWMRVNGESIYASQASPFAQPEWGRYTSKENKLYAHVFDWPKNGKLEVAKSAKKVTKVTLLAIGFDLPFSETENGIIVDLPANAPDKIASVLVFDF